MLVDSFNDLLISSRTGNIDSAHNIVVRAQKRPQINCIWNTLRKGEGMGRVKFIRLLKKVCIIMTCILVISHITTTSVHCILICSYIVATRVDPNAPTTTDHLLISSDVIFPTIYHRMSNEKSWWKIVSLRVLFIDIFRWNSHAMNIEQGNCNSLMFKHILLRCHHVIWSHDLFFYIQEYQYYDDQGIRFTCRISLKED